MLPSPVCLQNDRDNLISEKEFLEMVKPQNRVSAM